MENKKSQIAEEILTAEELSAYLKIKKNTIYQWVSQSRIPYVKIGSRTLFLREEIDRWLREHLIKEKDFDLT